MFGQVPFVFFFDLCSDPERVSDVVRFKSEICPETELHLPSQEWKSDLFIPNSCLFLLLYCESQVLKCDFWAHARCSVIKSSPLWGQDHPSCKGFMRTKTF